MKIIIIIVKSCHNNQQRRVSRQLTPRKLRTETLRKLQTPRKFRPSENSDPWQAKKTQQFEGHVQQTSMILSCYYIIILTKASTLLALGRVLSGLTVEPNTILPETWNHIRKKLPRDQVCKAKLYKSQVWKITKTNPQTISRSNRKCRQTWSHFIEKIAINFNKHCTTFNWKQFSVQYHY